MRVFLLCFGGLEDGHVQIFRLLLQVQQRFRGFRGLAHQLLGALGFGVCRVCYHFGIRNEKSPGSGWHGVISSA